MSANVVKFVLFLVIVTMLTGCGIIGLPPWGGSAYGVDLGKIGTGEQAVTPRNDPWHSGGMPMDMRTRR